MLTANENRRKGSMLTDRRSLSSFRSLPPSTSRTARCSRRYFYRSKDQENKFYSDELIIQAHKTSFVPVLVNNLEKVSNAENGS